MKKEVNYEIIPRKERNGRTSKRPKLSQLKEDYLTMTTRQIARKYQVGESTVRNWVYRARREHYNK